MWWTECTGYWKHICNKMRKAAIPSYGTQPFKTFLFFWLGIHRGFGIRICIGCIGEVFSWRPPGK